MAGLAGVQQRIGDFGQANGLDSGAVQKVLGSNFAYVEETRFDKKSGVMTFKVTPSTMADKMFTSGTLRMQSLGEHRCRRRADEPVQNHRHPRSHSADVRDQALELVFGTVGGEISNLRLEGQHLVGSGIHDGGAKVKDALRVAAPVQREFGGIGVQTHAQKRLVQVLRIAQLLGKCGAVRAHRDIVGGDFSADGRGLHEHGRGRSLRARHYGHPQPGK
jgi:hypothetical protein